MDKFRQMIIADLQHPQGAKNKQGNTILWQEKLVSDITVMVAVQLRPEEKVNYETN